MARILRQVLAPVFDEWETTQRYAAALAITYRGDAAGRALELVADFHRRLCSYTCLDPAAGTGNILVVVIETFVELEAAAVHWLRWLGAPADVFECEVRLRQFHGIEVDPEAWRISRMVLPLAWMQARQRHGLPPTPGALRDLAEAMPVAPEGGGGVLTNSPPPAVIPEHRKRRRAAAPRSAPAPAAPLPSLLAEPTPC